MADVNSVASERPSGPKECQPERNFSKSDWSSSARLYLCLTLFVAASALGIYNQGGFGIAHVLAVLTLIAIAGGFVMEKYKIFGGMSKYFQALGYTSTLLFHMLPAITDFLRRLPIEDPFIESFEDPLLINFHLSFLVVYLFGLSYQMYWLRQQ